MAVLITDHSDALAKWCIDEMFPGRGGTFGLCCAIGIASDHTPDGKLYGVVVFHDYQPANQTIQFSAAARSPKWASPAILRAILAYPFHQLGVFKIWGAIDHTNKRAIRFNRGIGMRQEGVLRHHFGEHRHAVIVSMLRPEYEASRWYRPAKLQRAA
jgi:RimJ/RimL family protein N-acetyltransferase